MSARAAAVAPVEQRHLNAVVLREHAMLPVHAATIITETINAGPTGPTDRMLSERLQELEGEGLVDRTVVPDTPVRVEYSLTKKGRALAGAMDAIASWAEKWVALDVAPSKSAKATRLRKRA